MNKDPDTRKAFRLSLFLHGGVVGLAVVWMFLALLFHRPKEQPYVMELSGGPPTQQPPSPKKSAQPLAQPQAMPSLPKLDNRDVKPLPEPVEPKPSPAPKPPPKPVAKPVVKPVEPPPKLVDYRQFTKQNKLPAKVQAAPSSQTKAKPVSVPKIDSSAVLRDLRSNLSKEDSARVSGMSSSQQSDLFDYFQWVRSLIDANFRQPSGIVDGASAWVEFRIAGNGMVSNIRLISGSGNSAFDNAALAAVQALGKLTPPPGQVAYTRKIEFQANR